MLHSFDCLKTRISSFNHLNTRKSSFSTNQNQAVIFFNGKHVGDMYLEVFWLDIQIQSPSEKFPKDTNVKFGRKFTILPERKHFS